MAEFISGRQFAERAGISEGAVRKAIKAGHIKKAKNGIDWDVYGVDYTKTQNPLKKRSGLDALVADAVALTKGGDVLPVQRDDAVSVQIPSDVDDTEIDPQAMAKYATARAKKEAVDAERAKIKRDRELDVLVDREKAVKKVFELSRADRDAWQAWPNRVFAQMAAELEMDDKHKVLTVLEKHVREHLEERADAVFEL